MWSRLMGRTFSPIGLDVGDKTVRMVQLSRDGEGWSVAAATSRVMPAGARSLEERQTALTQLVTRMLKEGGFQGRRVVSALPSTLLQYKNLRLPRMPADELQAAVSWEAADRLHLSPDQVQVQFFDAGEVRQGDDVKVEVIAMAVATDEVYAHATALESAGMLPQAIESTPSALARLATVLENPDESLPEAPPRVTIDVGYGATKVLVSRHGRVLFFKQIDLGGLALDEAVAVALGMPLEEAAELRRVAGREGVGFSEPDHTANFGNARREDVSRSVHDAIRPVLEELSREVQLCLRYYSVTFRGRRPESACLTGGESQDGWIRHQLSEGTGLTVNPLSALGPVRWSGAAGAASAWATAVGLALRDDVRTVRRERMKGAAA